MSHLERGNAEEKVRTLPVEAHKSRRIPDDSFAKRALDCGLVAAAWGCGRGMVLFRAGKQKILQMLRCFCFLRNETEGMRRTAALGKAAISLYLTT